MNASCSVKTKGGDNVVGFFLEKNRTPAAVTTEWG